MPADPYRVAPRTMLLAQRQRAESRYLRALRRIFRQIRQAIASAVTPAAAARALLQIAASPQFDTLCREAARQMVTQLAVGQRSTWRAAAAASGQGRRIYRALMSELARTGTGQAVSQIVQQNAQLIRTVPTQLAGRITDLVKQRRFEGFRPEDIMQEVRKMAPHLTDVEARRIARTESSKASTALVQARAEALGLDFYIWRTARDGERVRSSHRMMEGVICRWSDPPDPEGMAGERSYGAYHPGGIFNCRCIALPVIAPEDIEFPAKIHVSGKVEVIASVRKFRDRFGISGRQGESVR